MPEPYTVLHGGFHKTASTFLQKTLHRNQNFLAKRGVYYVHHRDMRKKFTVPCQQNAYHHIGVHRKTVIDDTMLRGLTTQFYTPVADAAPDRLILTDENLAGHCGHCVKTGDLYQYREPFIKIFSRETPFTVREVHLAIRNYADFFAAAYVEYVRALQSNSVKFVTQQVMCQKVFKRLPGWNGVIGVIKSQFPEAKIILWRFEDFAAEPKLGSQIIRNLVGDQIDMDKLKPAKDDSRRPSASARAMAEIQLMVQREGVPAAAEQIRAIQEKYPRGDAFGSFDPWTEWERAHLTRLYEKDFARLCDDKAVEIVRPA